MSRTELLLSCFALLSIVGCSSETVKQEASQTVDPPAEHAEQAEVSAEQFHRHLKDDRLVLAKFGAPWCPPCVELDPVLDQLEEANEGDLAVIRINVDDEPDLTAEYDIDTIPRIFLFRNGKMIGDWDMPEEASVFQKAIDDAVAASAPVSDVQVNDLANPES